MRVVAAIVGVVLMLGGLGVLTTGAVAAYQEAYTVIHPGADWTCSVKDSVQNCEYAIDSMPRKQIDVGSDIAVTVAGSAVAICGAILLLIGTRRFPRAATVAAAPAYPAAGPDTGGHGAPQWAGHDPYGRTTQQP